MIDKLLQINKEVKSIIGNLSDSEIGIYIYLNDNYCVDLCDDKKTERECLKTILFVRKLYREFSDRDVEEAIKIIEQKYPNIYMVYSMYFDKIINCFKENNFKIY